MDLSFLSEEELQALEKGDYSKISDTSLSKLEQQGQGNEDLVDPATPQPTGGGKSIQLPPDLQALQGAYRNLPFNSKEQKQAQEIFSKELEMYLKTNPQLTKGLTQADMKEKAKGNIAKDIANIFQVLPEIETYDGWKSVPAWLTQLGGSMIGENPELSQYRNKIEQLKIPVVKQIQGDVGAVSDIQERKAKEYFPSGADMLFEERGRPRGLINLFQGVESGTGINLTDLLSREQIEKAGGPDPEGMLKAFLDQVYGQATAAPTTSKPSSGGGSAAQKAQELLRQRGIQ